DQTLATRRIDLAIEGMSCASCVGRVERALARVPGVASAQVNLATETARIEGAVGSPELIAAVERAGYKARHATTAAPRDQTRREIWELIASAALTLPLLLGMAPGLHHALPGWLQLALAAPVQF